MSHDRLIEFKLQRSCTPEELLELSFEQMVDMTERPSLERRDPERIELIKWLYKDDWEQYMGVRFRVELV